MAFVTAGVTRTVQNVMAFKGKTRNVSSFGLATAASSTRPSAQTGFSRTANGGPIRKP